MRPILHVFWAFSLACAARPDVEVLGAEDLGPLETASAVKARDGGYSVAFGDRSAWLYGDTILSLTGADGSSWRDNSWSWTEDLAGVVGFAEPVDALGAPEEFFPETDVEAAYNAAHGGEDCEEPCGGREVLWPMAAVAVEDRVLAFYVKIHGEPGAWNFFARGYGVAVWDDFDAGPTRPEVAPGTDEPTLLFTEEVDDYGVAAVVVGEDLYAYACGSEDGWTKPCRVARVAVEDVLDRDAWTFWDGGAWSADPVDAAELFEGNSQMTVHWNPHLERFLAVHVDGDHVVLRTAEAPEGPWSREVEAFTTLPAYDDGFVYCGLGHAELMRDGGGTEIVSYYRGTGDWTGEVRVVAVDVAPR